MNNKSRRGLNRARFAFNRRFLIAVSIGLAIAGFLAVTESGAYAQTDSYARQQQMLRYQAQRAAQQRMAAERAAQQRAAQQRQAQQRQAQQLRSQQQKAQQQRVQQQLQQRQRAQQQQQQQRSQQLRSQQQQRERQAQNARRATEKRATEIARNRNSTTMGNNRSVSTAVKALRSQSRTTHISQTTGKKSSTGRTTSLWGQSLHSQRGAVRNFGGILASKIVSKIRFYQRRRAAEKKVDFWRKAETQWRHTILDMGGISQGRNPELAKLVSKTAKQYRREFRQRYASLYRVVPKRPE